MKKIPGLIVFLFPVMLFAQSVAINTDNSIADNTAILDIKSKTKGLLIPRLTTLERTTIAGPALGLTVYDITTNNHWVYRGDVNGGWVELMNSLDKHWDRTGTHAFNTNPGNIGIGTNIPTQKLAINATDPAIDFMNAGISKGYLQANGNNMRIGTYANNSTGSIVFNTKAVDRMWIDDAGKVGIGTATPNGALTIDGANPYLEMRSYGTYKGYLWALANDMLLGTSATNTTGNLALQTKLLTRLIIDENGKVAIGTTTPSANGIFTVNDNNPLIQLENLGTGKGFIQVLGDDMKIGTNTSNANGKFIVRTGGQDRVFVDNAGNLSLGTSTASAPLTINNASPKIDLNKSNVNYGGISVIGNDFIIRTPYIANSKIVIKNGNVNSINLHSNSNFNYGTGLNPANYLFSVEGGIIATGFTTLAVNNWPDYVFEDEYKLKPLAEVKKFIAENKHLPNVPSAKELEKNGIELGDMSKRLMEKVEELTLYVIQLHEQNIQLQKQVDELKKGNQ